MDLPSCIKLQASSRTRLTHANSTLAVHSLPMPRKNQQTLPQLSDDGSDDAGLMAAVAKQVQGTLEKKRKESETKFLATAKAELSKSASAEIEEFEDALSEMAKTFDSFLMRYAAAEDNIRALLSQLQIEQQKFSDACEKRHAAIISSDKDREAGQVRAMAVSKRAVEDCARLIATLSPEA